MKNNLFEILSKYNLDLEDVNDILSICPSLEIADSERIIKNISLLEQFGFPRYEIDSLIMTNPDFLLNDPKHLAEKLMKITGNLEEKLKADPFLI